MAITMLISEPRIDLSICTSHSGWILFLAHLWVLGLGLNQFYLKDTVHSHSPF